MNADDEVEKWAKKRKRAMNHSKLPSPVEDSNRWRPEVSSFLPSQQRRQVQEALAWCTNSGTSARRHSNTPYHQPRVRPFHFAAVAQSSAQRSRESCTEPAGLEEAEREPQAPWVRYRADIRSQERDSIRFQKHKPVSTMIAAAGSRMAGRVEHGWHSQESATSVYGWKEEKEDSQQHQVDTHHHSQASGPGGGTAALAVAVEG